MGIWYDILPFCVLVWALLLCCVFLGGYWITLLNDSSLLAWLVCLGTLGWALRSARTLGQACFAAGGSATPHFSSWPLTIKMRVA